MKKILLWGLLLCFLLSGCQEQQEQVPFTKELGQQILSSGVFTYPLDELDCDTAWALYGLEGAGLQRQQLTDGMVYGSAGAGCEELAVLIFDDEDSASLALQALSNYLQNQIRSNEDYRPLEIPKLEDAVLRQRGNTVLLVVSADSAAVETLLGD